MSLAFGFDVFPLFVGVAFLVFLWKFFQKDERSKIINKLPGPRAFPIVGNIVEFLEPKDAMLDNILKRRKAFGPIFRVWLGSHPAVILSKAEYVEDLLKSTKHSEKSFTYKFLHSWLGTGLLTAYGKKWADHRKLITPTFHFTVLQNFSEIYQENAKILVGKLKEKADTGEEFNIFPSVTLCALDIICETAMGTKINAQLESQSEYVRSVYALSSLIVNRIGRIWLHPDFVFNLCEIGKQYKKHLGIVQGFTEKVIRARKEALENKADEEGGEKFEKKRDTFLDLLLKASTSEEGNKLTDVELREEVDTFMFEGHDTTAAGMSWTLFLLGNHPKIQQEVYDEVKKVFDGKRGEFLTMGDFAEMKLLERVLKEALRLFPSVVSIGRTVEDDIRIGEYSIPKGTSAVVAIYTLHRDPDYYPEPEVFDPDRFLPENSLKRHPFAYLPFSAGPRNCIGQKFAMLEEKAVLSNLIFNYKFESVEKMEEVKKIPELILRPKNGIRLKITKR